MSYCVRVRNVISIRYHCVTGYEQWRRKHATTTDSITICAREAKEETMSNSLFGRQVLGNVRRGYRRNDGTYQADSWYISCVHERRYPAAKKCSLVFTTNTPVSIPLFPNANLIQYTHSYEILCPLTNMNGINAA
jgi:hypothetical protein